MTLATAELTARIATLELLMKPLDTDYTSLLPQE
jgi:hypothetical protein